MCCLLILCVWVFFFGILHLVCVCVAKTVVLTQERVDVQQAAPREALWFLTRLLTQVLSFLKGCICLSPRRPSAPPHPPTPPHPCLKIALALHMRYLIGLNMNKLCTTLFRDSILPRRHFCFPSVHVMPSIYLL